MDQRHRPLLLLGALLGASQNAMAQSPPAGGRVIGRVTAVAPGDLPETVIYLNALDAAARFAVPQQPIALSQAGAQFSPGLLVVSVGQTVEFLNDEPRPVQHNVFSKSPAKPFDLGLYKPGESRRVLFDRPGPVHLHCSIHRNMDGVVFVSPTPFFAIIGADGRFALEGVAPGEYELKTWQRRQRYLDRSLRIRVTAGGETRQDVELTRK